MITLLAADVFWIMKSFDSCTDLLELITTFLSCGGLSKSGKIDSGAGNETRPVFSP